MFSSANLSNWVGYAWLKSHLNLYFCVFFIFSTKFPTDKIKCKLGSIIWSQAVTRNAFVMHSYSICELQSVLVRSKHNLDVSWCVRGHNCLGPVYFSDRPGCSGGHAGWRRKDPGSGAFPPAVCGALLDWRDRWRFGAWTAWPPCPHPGGPHRGLPQVGRTTVC